MSSPVHASLRTPGRFLRREGRELLLGDQPIRLVGYSGFDAAVNPHVDLEQYFAAMQQHGLNLQRTWAVQSSLRGRLSVFARDQEAPVRYDLSAIDPDFFQRVRQVIALAAHHGVVVQLCLFAPPQCQPQSGEWEHDPWNAANNSNGCIEPGRYPSDAWVHEFYFNAPRDAGPVRRQSTDAALYHLQKDFVQSLVMATCEYWNVIYEIANEARCYSGVPQQGVVWHQEVAEWVKAVDRDLLVSSCTTINPYLGDPHRIGALEDGVNSLPDIDMFSLHYHAWRTLGAPTAPVAHWTDTPGYEELRNNDESYIPLALAGADNGCGGYLRYGKPVIVDDDGAFAQDETGLCHRDHNEVVARWALTAVSCGAHFHHKDLLPVPSASSIDYQAMGALARAARPDFSGKHRRTADLLSLVR